MSRACLWLFSNQQVQIYIRLLTMCEMIEQQDVHDINWVTLNNESDYRAIRPLSGRYQTNPKPTPIAAQSITLNVELAPMKHTNYRSHSQLTPSRFTPYGR